MMAAYREVLRRWGIPATKNLINLMTKAINQMWGTTLFIDHLRHTPEYRAKFPGIKYSAGMTEAQYNAQYASFRSQARSIGVTLDRKTFAKMVKRGVSPQEYQDRIAAINSINSWGPLMGYFRESLAANGYVNKATDVTKGNLVKFAMRLGDPKWEQLWEQTIIQAQVERIAGITVGDAPKGWGEGGQYHIDRNDLFSIVKQVEALTPGFEVENITGQQWRDIGARVRKFDPKFLRAYGLEEKDLIEMELGGPRAAEIAERADRILATQEAVQDPRALPQQAQAVGSTTAARNEQPQSY